MAVYTLATGKTWATGESVTAAKLNTQVDSATITIANNLIGVASCTDNNIVLFDGTTGALVKDSGGAITSAEVSASSTDADIPTGEAVWEAIVTEKPVALGTTSGIDVGSMRMRWYSPSGQLFSNAATPVDVTISGFSAISSVMVTTGIASEGANFRSMWQLVGTPSTTNVKIQQQIMDLGYTGDPTTNATILVIGTAS